MRPCRFAGPASATSDHWSVIVVFDLDGIAYREDVRRAGAHPIVNANPAQLTDFQPGCLRQPGFRAHADPQHHEVGRIDLAGARECFERAVAVLLKPADIHVEHEANAVLFQVAFDVARDLQIHRRQHLVSPLEQRHLEPQMHQVLGHLEADKTAADHHGALRRHHRLESRVGVHAGGQRGAPIDPLADRLGIRHRPHPKDAGQINAR